MLEVAARIPDATARDQFADRLAHRARITEEVVRTEIKRAAARKETTVAVLDRPAVGLDRVKTAEKSLIWALMRRTGAAVEALRRLDADDLVGLETGSILEQARSLQDWPEEALPAALLERLTKGEAQVVSEIARAAAMPGDPADCVWALKRLRYTRERADVQREIDRLQEAGAARHEREIIALWDRKKALARLIEES
jgi:hypothetical protein